MSPSGLHARGTPTARTPESGVARVASEGRASRAVARALGQLVERILALGVVDRGLVSALDGTESIDALRDSLRQLAARSRDGALLCRVVSGALVLEGVVVDRQAETDDPWLQLLLARLNALHIGALTVREGAAPGELLTLGRLLAQSHETISTRTPARGVAVTDVETPTTVQAVDYPDDSPRELLRTWSVLVTTASNARAPREDFGVASTAAGSALARLASARTDDAATTAVNALREVISEAQRRGDRLTIEGVARACLTHLQSLGESGGRLALEGLVRTLLKPAVLELLAQQFPHSTDRPLLLQLFSRAGDAGVAVLVQQLLATEDALSRRAYFDGIVAMDVGSSALFQALGDSRWFVVRNAAALLGEMGVEHADEVLIPLLRHEDERIRIAVSRALMRLRTAKAMQALHGMIDDQHAEVRRLSAAAFGLAGSLVGGGVRPPAARIASALERERDDDVALEMLAALGRLGSADAVQRLLRLALPVAPDMVGETAAPRDAWLRIAALEALVRARGSQMQPVIDALVQDADPEVASAAASLRAN